MAVAAAEFGEYQVQLELTDIDPCMDVSKIVPLHCISRSEPEHDESLNPIPVKPETFGLSQYIMFWMPKTKYRNYHLLMVDYMERYRPFYSYSIEDKARIDSLARTDSEGMLKAHHDFVPEEEWVKAENMFHMRNFDRLMAEQFPDLLS